MRHGAAGGLNAGLGEGRFVGGTRIAVSAPGGQTPGCENMQRQIEELAPGDLVHALGGVPRRVTRIDKRLVDIAAHAAPTLVVPVRMRAEALGPGCPRRDLLLPPEALLLFRPADADGALVPAAAVGGDGVLVPVGALVNGGSITREPASGVLAWYTMGLEAHDVILAENVPVASRRDGEAPLPRGPLCARLLPAGPVPGPPARRPGRTPRRRQQPRGGRRLDGFRR